MGIVTSAFQGVHLCMDRISNWGLCACILSAIMWLMMLLIIYGMTIGYHTGQKGLVEFSLKARGIKKVLKYEGPLRQAGENTTDLERRAMLQLKLSTPISGETPSNSMLDFDPNESQRTVLGPANFSGFTEIPVFMQFKDLSRTEESMQADGFPGRRYRRSKNNIFNIPFWRPLKKSD